MKNFCNAIIQKLNPDYEPSYNDYINTTRNINSRKSLTKTAVSSTASSNSTSAHSIGRRTNESHYQPQTLQYREAHYKAYSPIYKLNDFR